MSGFTSASGQRPTSAPSSIALRDFGHCAVTVHDGRTLRCSCSEFQHFTFCEHVLTTWRTLQPLRAHALA